MISMLAPYEPLTKDEIKQRVSGLRRDLLLLQRRVIKHDQPVIIVIAGDDRSGRHETINSLCKWMDPRFVSVNAYGPSQHEDNARPFFWRFWRDSPKAGEIAIFLRDWTSTSLVQFLNGEISDEKLKRREQYIRNFERKHTDAGALMIKCWLHIAEDELKTRLESNRDTPYYDPKDELALDNYPVAMETFQKTLGATSVEKNVWHVIDGKEPELRDLQAGELVRSAIETWLTRPAPMPQTIQYLSDSRQRPDINMPPSPPEDEPEKNDAKKKIKKLQAKLREQMYTLQKKDIPVVIAFEGWDAAGKGGAIRRVVAPLDAGFYRIYPIAAPSGEEKAHHYLWRFWKHVPSNGRMAIFDRSWYGRVLVERVEGFAREHEWRNAYKEINDFEEQLAIHGTLVFKFWLNISKEEQLRRFQEREKVAHKQFKITDEDWRNRERWDDYVTAVEDMVARTSTEIAPWTIVNSDYKDDARIKVLKTLTRGINNSSS